MVGWETGTACGLYQLTHQLFPQLLLWKTYVGVEPDPTWKSLSTSSGDGDGVSNNSQRFPGKKQKPKVVVVPVLIVGVIVEKYYILISIHSAFS